MSSLSFFGFKVTNIYEDGTTYSSDILDMTAEELMGKFLKGVSKVAALSLAIGYPTQASLPHIIGNAYKKLMSIDIEADLDLPQVKQFKTALAAPIPKAQPTKSPGVGPKAAPAAAAPAKKEEKEEPEEEVFLDLFS